MIQSQKQAHYQAQCVDMVRQLLRCINHQSNEALLPWPILTCSQIFKTIEPTRMRPRGHHHGSQTNDREPCCWWKNSAMLFMEASIVSLDSLSQVILGLRHQFGYSGGQWDKVLMLIGNIFFFYWLNKPSLCVLCSVSLLKLCVDIFLKPDDLYKVVKHKWSVVELFGASRGH